MPAPPPLRPLGRCLGALVAWGVLAAASPGVLLADGSPLLAAAGVGVWGWVEARPYRGRAWLGFLAHALGTLPGAAAAMLWIRHVYAPPLLYIGLGYGVYSAAGGVLLRRLLPRLGAAPAVAVALAFTALETLRAAVPMPFGLGWMRVGFHAHAWLPVAASARVWGVVGLTFALAALGGWGAHVVRGRRAALAPAALAGGLGPLALALVLGAATSAPATVPGPRVLVVQPGFEQARKQLDDPAENFAALVAATREALAAERAAGNPAPDLVAWGESMLYLPVAAPGVEALASGDGPGLGAVGAPPVRSDLAWMRRREDAWVRGVLFGRGRGEPVLPEGASFLAGAEVFVAREGAIRRQNGAVIYAADGARAPRHAAKRYLVPGAETMYGLERLGPVRSFILAVAGYVPNFLAATETGVLPLEARDGRAFRLATTVCFDNAHLAAYTDPVAAGPVDLHVVVSNEAWYRESFEADQMVAFTRIAALASGRAVLRATNSGISLLMGPDGRERGRVTADGRAKMVAGHLAATVPVPAGGAPAPPIVRWRGALAWLGVLLPLALGLPPRRRHALGNRAGAGG